MKKTLATIDLGSNSFHMMIVQVSHDNLEPKILARQKQKVQLRAGIDASGALDAASQDRAFKCFERFARLLERYQVEHVDVVGTYTLRSAKDVDPFLARAKTILGHPIRVIPGEEEARLIYVGASSVNPLEQRHLVVDIGGGSTELIIGEAGKILALTSLDMGCVSYQQQFFADGETSEANMTAAMASAAKTLLSVQSTFQEIHWNHVLGTSGTVQAISGLLASEYQEACITQNNLKRLREAVIACKTVDQVHFKGLRGDRENILPGGLAVLSAIVETLDMQSMKMSRAAVREGVLQELINTVFSR